MSGWDCPVILISMAAETQSTPNPESPPQPNASTEPAAATSSAQEPSQPKTEDQPAAESKTEAPPQPEAKEEEKPSTEEKTEEKPAEEAKTNDHPPAEPKAAEGHQPAHPGPSHHPTQPEAQDQAKPLGLGGSIKEVFKSVRSSDPPTRRMALVFILGFIGFLTVIGSSIWVLRSSDSSHSKAHSKKGEASEHTGHSKDASEAGDHYKNRLVELGEFQIELKATVDPESPTQVSNLATIAVVLLLDSPETAEHAKHSKDKLRNVMINIFSIEDREVLMSAGEKKKLKSEITKKVNAFLEHGQVVEVYFPKLLLN